ncbi:MAG: HlyC/CorC family transporter [Proteobacteria bacterium]|nr:HlyC/CorC family transporter [Pseudomonadota bacterium]
MTGTASPGPAPEGARPGGGPLAPGEEGPAARPRRALARIGERLRAGLLRLRRGRPGDGAPAPPGAVEPPPADREESAAGITRHERRLVANIRKLRDLTVADVMVPRADIVAVEAGTSFAELVALIAEKAHSRLPVYRESLDEVIGMVHIKDVLGWVGRADAFRLDAVLRRPLFVAPSMPAPDLLVEMREKRTHMALVVDEYGGIDGLVTIEDLVEEIVGDIQDEHDVSEGPMLVARADGGLDADARCPIEELEALIGRFLTEEERAEDIDTLGGLVVSIAGRVPARGELVAHGSGLEFQVTEADPRRIRRLIVRNLPPAAAPATAGAESAGGGRPADAPPGGGADRGPA